MDDASSALMKLRPVTFHYKSDQNPAGRVLQYGLIAEEVNEVYPGLVAHSAEGQIETVMYQHLPPMLLNEFQKQQRTIAAQAGELARHSIRMETLERELLAIKAMLGGK
ncbi:MAG: tail fiber domain-containing protein [Betaproteobacteria bacterium]|nr:tail fiber domain-containing protein [Betaproteobacteria bacterium]